MAASLSYSPGLDDGQVLGTPNRTDVQSGAGYLSTESLRQILPLSEVVDAEVDATQPKFNGADPTSPQPRSYDITTTPGSCFFCGEQYLNAGPVAVALVLAHLVECSELRLRSRVRESRGLLVRSRLVR